jgi:hypothetical protein
MAKTKKAAAAAEPAELDELAETKKELAHWEQYLKSQGITDEHEPHVYSETIANLKARIKKLEA